MVTVISKPYLLRKYLPDIDPKMSTRLGTLGCYRYQFDDRVEVPEAVVCQPLKFYVKESVSSHRELQLKQIIKEICYRYAKVKPESFQRDDDFLIPMCDREYIYMTEAELHHFDQIDLNLYDGYQALYCDPLVWKALETTKYVRPHKLGGLMVVADDIDQVYSRELNEILTFALKDTVHELSDKGYTAFFLDIDSPMLKLIREIARVWNFEHEIVDGSLVIRSKDHFGCTLHRWIKRSIEQCMSNKLPIMHFSGPWVDMEANYRTISKLKYLAHLSYLECIKVNPFLDRFTDQIQIMSDLSLSVPFFSMDEYRLFRRVFDLQVGSIDDITVHPFANQDQALRVKEAIERKYPNSKTLVIGGKLVVSNVRYQPNSEDLTDITGVAAPSTASLSSGLNMGPSWINKVRGLTPKTGVSGFTDGSYQKIVPVDMEVTTDQFGCRLGPEYILRLVEPVDDEEMIKMLDVAFKSLWWKGHFVTTWGNLYWEREKQLSVSYLRNVYIFDNAEQALSYLHSAVQ